jgi:hypothetical protein
MTRKHGLFGETLTFFFLLFSDSAGIGFALHRKESAKSKNWLTLRG